MEPSPNNNTAEKLRQALGENALEMLASLVCQLKEDGYGAVEIIIADKRFSHFRIVTSRKPDKDVIAIE